MEAYKQGRTMAKSDHLFRGEVYTKRKAMRGLWGQSPEFINGYVDYARLHCTIRRKVM